MDKQKTDFHHEPIVIEKASLLSYENKAKGISKPNNEKTSREFNGKQIQVEYFVPQSIKQEEIHIKSEEEEEEGNLFSTNKFNENQIQDGYFDSKPIIQEKIKTKNENEEDISTESLAVKSENGLQPANKVIHLNSLLSINANNHRGNLEEPTVFTCFKCSYKTHTKNKLRRHIICHMPKNFECPLCPYKSNKHFSLKRHQLGHIPKEEAELYKCSKCPFTSRRKYGLNRHLIVHKKPEEIIWYQCPECPYRTKYKSGLQNRHIWMHRNDPPMHKCTLCSYESFRKDAVESHVNFVHKPKNLPFVSCPEEDCSFKSRNHLSLQTHIRVIHNCQKIYKCPKCFFETKYLANLKMHTLRHENSVKGFSCPLCPFKTMYKYGLTSHALVHKSTSESKLFSCSKCSFKTKHKRVLKQHNLKHSSEAREFTGWLYCYLCTYRTVFKRYLPSHISKHHRDTEGHILSLGKGSPA